MNSLKNRTKVLAIEKKDIYFLILMILAAIGFRSLLLKYRFAVCFDEINYLKLAVSGAQNSLSQVFHTYWSPFYPFVVALVSKIIPNYEMVGRFVSILSGTLVLIPIFIFTNFYFGKRIAKYSLVLLAFYPSLAFFQTKAQTESLYILIIITAIFIGWLVLLKRSYLLGFILGILFGLAYLTKPEGIGFLIVFCCIVALLLIYSLIYKKICFDLLLTTLVLISGFSIVASPYLVYLHNATGEWTISAKGKANQQFEAFSSGAFNIKKEAWPFRQLSEDNTQVPIDQIYHIGSFIQSERHKGTPTVKVSPMIIVKKYFKNFHRVLKYGIPQALTTIVFILMVLGMFGEAWSKERTLRELYLLSYIAFFWLLVIPLFHINERYFLPLLPICFIWVGKGLDTLINWLQKSMTPFINGNKKRVANRKVAVGIAVLVILFGLYAPQMGKIITRDRLSNAYWAEPVEQKMAGLWLKKYSKKIPVIMSRAHTVDFYAGNYNIAESITIPENDLSRILKYAEYRGVDYLELNERYAANYPNLNHLLDEVDVPENLKLIYRNEFKPGLKTVIYELIKQ